MKKIILILLIILSVGASAQENTLSFDYVEKTTLYNYNTGNWASLIYTGQQAQKQGIDYYYLNYRLGVAFYMLQDYIMSAKYLEKAAEQNSGALKDSVFVNLLVNDYLFTKNYGKAEELRKNISGGNSEGVKYAKALSQLYVEGGTAFVQNLDDKAFKERKFYYFKEFDALQNLQYFNIDLQGFISPKLSYQAAFSGLKLDRYKFYKEFPDTIEQNYTINQSYVYASLNYRFANFFINPAVNSPGYNSTEILINGKDETSGRNIYDTLKLVSRNVVLALQAGYYYRKMRFSLFGSYSNMHGSEQYQAGAGFFYMPKGNLNFYFNTQLTGHWEGGTAYLILRQKLGAKLTSFLWSELQFTVGNLHDFTADNGYYIYNTYDKIKSISDLNLLFLINKHLELDLVMQYLWKQNVMYSYPSKYNTTLQTTDYYFQQFNLIGGIKWKF